MGDYSRDKSYGKPPKWKALYGEFFPTYTDGCSRHVVMLAEDLRNPKSPVRRWLIDSGYEPDHMASSMEATVKNLWQERKDNPNYLPRLEAQTAETVARMKALNPVVEAGE